VDILLVEWGPFSVDAVERKKLVLSGAPDTCRLYGSLGEIFVDSVGLFIQSFL
jgi:hypothetical protein